MKEKASSKKTQVYLLSAVLLIIFSFTIVMVTYARYQKKTEESLEFVVGEGASFDIQNAGQWVDSETEEGTKELFFSVTNDSDSNDSYFNLQILATDGLKPDESQVSIVVKNSSGIEREYIGEASLIPEDSTLYEDMGAGHEYHFFDSEGKELVWSLEGGKLSEREFTLRISGITAPCLIELLVSQTIQK